MKHCVYFICFASLFVYIGIYSFRHNVLECILGDQRNTVCIHILMNNWYIQISECVFEYSWVGTISTTVAMLIVTATVTLKR